MEKANYCDWALVGSGDRRAAPSEASRTLQPAWAETGGSPDRASHEKLMESGPHVKPEPRVGVKLMGKRDRVYVGV